MGGRQGKHKSTPFHCSIRTSTSSREVSCGMSGVKIHVPDAGGRKTGLPGWHPSQHTAAVSWAVSTYHHCGHSFSWHWFNLNLLFVKKKKKKRYIIFFFRISYISQTKILQKIVDGRINTKHRRTLVISQIKPAGVDPAASLTGGAIMTETLFPQQKITMGMIYFTTIVKFGWTWHCEHFSFFFYLFGLINSLFVSYYSRTQYSDSLWWIWNQRSFVSTALTCCVVLHPVDVLGAGSLHNPAAAAPRPARSNLIGRGVAI